MEKEAKEAKKGGKQSHSGGSHRFTNSNVQHIPEETIPNDPAMEAAYDDLMNS